MEEQWVYFGCRQGCWIVIGSSKQSVQVLLGQFDVTDDVTAGGGINCRPGSLVVHVVTEDDLCPVLYNAH